MRTETGEKFLPVLKRIMSVNKWKQRDVARMCDIPVSYISRILSGDVNLTFETLDKLQNGLGYEMIRFEVGEPIPRSDQDKFHYIVWNYGNLI